MYDYYIKANLIAYTPGDESNDLWNKEYKLSEVETVDFKNSNSYNVSKNVKIDYQTIKNEYESYRASSKVLSNAKLIVELVVNNHGKYQTLDDFDFGANSKLEIPLSESTFQIKKNISVNGDTKTIEKNPIMISKLLLLWLE